MSFQHCQVRGVFPGLSGKGDVFPVLSDKGSVFQVLSCKGYLSSLIHKGSSKLENTFNISFLYLVPFSFFDKENAPEKCRKCARTICPFLTNDLDVCLLVSICRCSGYYIAKRPSYLTIQGNATSGGRCYS